MQKLKNTEVHWSCPNCTDNYVGKCPTYRCFCGRQDCPEFNPYTLPHSCGRLCEKKRHPWCTHTPCNVMCHPGQCETCEELMNLECFCGRESKVSKCCQAETKFSCGRQCGNLLSCGKHYCEDLCDDKTSCKPCAVTVKSKCYCGKEERTVLCGNEKFGCGKICGKGLECEAHCCDKICHSGDCGECALLPSKITTCPCGKMKLEVLASITREKCTDPIDICGMPCGKLLPCGIHNCKSTCHVGPCPPCKEPVNQCCRCGSTKRKIECYFVNYSDENLLRLNIDKINIAFMCKKK